jgi:hypothetical protein
MKRKAIYLVLTGLVIGLAAFKIKDNMTDESESIIVNWIDSIEKIPAGHFVTVPAAKDLPDPPKTESRHWSGIFFLPKMGPYEIERKPRYSYVCNHNDLDLLRHEIQLPNLETVVIYEGRNFFITRFSLQQSPPGDPLALAQKKAEQLLNMHGEDYKWKFNSKQTIGTDILISTNRELSIVFMPDWMHRADALIRKDHLYLITYKKMESVTGLLNDYQWFPDELRH